MRALNFILLSSMVFLTGCSLSSSKKTTDPKPPEPPVVGTSKIQVIHASADAPKVNISLDGAVVAENVDYRQATGIVSVDEGTHSATVTAILPNETLDVIGPVDLELSADTIYSIMAVNDTANIEPLVLTRSDTQITSGYARIQIVHAAPNAPMVDVFATEPGADLSMSSPLVTANFKDSMDATEVPIGDYQIRITPAGDSSSVVYDSGTISLPDGGDFLIAAVENTGPGMQPVNLLLMDSMGASTVLDTNTPASVRVIHASPDAPAVDIVANDGFASPLISALEFPNAVGYVDLPADTYNIKVVPNGAEAPVVIDADLTLDGGTAYNVIATDNLASITALVLTADNRRIATEAKLRIVHGSPTAGDVDIYLVPVGTDIETVEPALSGVMFQADTDFLSVAPGDYDVVVTPAGSKTAAIGPATISLSASGIYTTVARDVVGGGTPLGLILLDDFQSGT